MIQSHEIEVSLGNGKAVKTELKMAASVEGETETDSETSGHQQGRSYLYVSTVRTYLEKNVSLSQARM